MPQGGRELREELSCTRVVGPWARENGFLEGHMYMYMCEAVSERAVSRVRSCPCVSDPSCAFAFGVCPALGFPCVFPGSRLCPVRG